VYSRDIGRGNSREGEGWTRALVLEDRALVPGASR
jgi:hypothetical protein